MAPAEKPHILLIGGSGFLGRAILHEFARERQDLDPASITVYDLKPPPENCQHDNFIQGDVRDTDKLKQVLKGIDIVFHLAAVVDWGTHPPTEVWEINVNAMERCIKASIEAGVKTFIFTSSLDAICSGKRIVNADEDLPYPRRHPNSYCSSKAAGEQLIRDVDPTRLKALALRPAGIYGEADPYHISALIEMAKSWPYIRIGSGKALNTHVYVGNVAAAHIRAAAELYSGNEKVHGRAYFLTDHSEANFFHFLDEIVRRAGYEIRPRSLWLPKGLVWTLGALSELAAFLLRPFIRLNPKLTRFAVYYTTTDFTVRGDRFKRDFSFTPPYSEEEAVQRTAEYFRKQD